MLRPWGDLIRESGKEQQQQKKKSKELDMLRSMF